MRGVIVVDFDDDTMNMQMLEPGTFLLLTEAPLKLYSRLDEADGTITLVMKPVIVPPSAEGLEPKTGEVPDVG